MLNSKKYSRKILLLVVFFCFAIFSSNLFSLSVEEKKTKINVKIENIFKKLDSRSFIKQTQFYKLFKKIA